MSQHTDQVYVSDMLGACAKVERYVRGLDWQAFKNDELTQDAVIRQLEIIGEAGARVSAGFQSLAADIPWRLIKDLRNVLIHGYASVRLDLVWTIACEDVPTLRKQLEALLGREIGPGTNS